MNNVTRELETNIKSIMSLLEDIKSECLSIYNVYWDTGIGTELASYADGDGVTVSTKLTKLEFINGITFAENLNKFFTNQAITQADYLGTSNNLKYGNDAKAEPIVSEACEDLGVRLVAMANECIEVFNSCKVVLSQYNDTSVYTAFASVNDSVVVFGADMTVNELHDGMVCIEQFKKLMNNEAVTTANYETTISKWMRI